MPRPALTEEQRRQIRHSIRSAAAKLYAENGMKDISARSIAKTAGVSVGTIYSHFGNLTELMQSFWKQPTRKMIQDLLVVAEEHSDPLARLRALIDVYVQFAFANWSVYRAAFMFVRPEGQEIPKQAPLTHDKFFQLLRDAVSEGQEQGQIRSGDPDEMVQTLWSGVHGAIALPTNFQRLALNDSPDRVEPMLQILFNWLTTNN